MTLLRSVSVPVGYRGQGKRALPPRRETSSLGEEREGEVILDGAVTKRHKALPERAIQLAKHSNNNKNSNNDDTLNPVSLTQRELEASGH